MQKVGTKMARIRAIFSCATATASFFYTFGLPERRSPFLIRAIGAVALKMVQVPSTGVLCRYGAQNCEQRLFSRTVNHL